MLSIRSHADPSLTCNFSRDVRDTHPQWVHDQLGTETESELQGFLDCCDEAEYVSNPERADDAGVFITAEEAAEFMEKDE